MFILFITALLVSNIALICNCIFGGSLLILIDKILAAAFSIIFLIWVIKYYGKDYISEIRKQFQKIQRHFRR